MTAQVALSPRLGDPLDRFLDLWPTPLTQLSAAGGQVVVFPQPDCAFHVLFLDDHAVALSCPYQAPQPHVHELEARVAPFQPPDAPNEPEDQKPTKLYLDDHGWTLALRTCSAEQVEAFVQVVTAPAATGE
jgi:hypothetical protein